jgi:hypothetical protein
MTSPQRLLGTSLAAALLLALLAYRHFAHSRSEWTENLNPHSALGTVLAEETSRLLNGKGQVVVVNFDPSKGFPGNLAPDTFRKVAPRYGLTVLATELVVYSPQLGLGQSALSPERLEQLLAQHVDADAIVSFVGMPALPPDASRHLPERRPRLICVGTDPALAAVLDLVVVPQDQPPTGPPPTSPRGWFDRHYRIVQDTTKR